VGDDNAVTAAGDAFGVTVGETGLTISSLYAVLPVLKRNYTLRLAADI
jgi:hypothetical protein